LNDVLAAEITQNLILPNLKIWPAPESIESESMIAAMKKDKKRTGDLLALIMMQNNFDFVRINDLTSAEVTAALTESKNILDL
jgi:3-dehydroquinate synthetase